MSELRISERRALREQVGLRLQTARQQANAGERADSERYHRHFTCLAIENAIVAVELLASAVLK